MGSCCGHCKPPDPERLPERTEEEGPVDHVLPGTRLQKSTVLDLSEVGLGLQITGGMDNMTDRTYAYARRPSWRPANATLVCVACTPPVRLDGVAMAQPIACERSVLHPEE